MPRNQFYEFRPRVLFPICLGLVLGAIPSPWGTSVFREKGDLASEAANFLLAYAISWSFMIFLAFEPIGGRQSEKPRLSPQTLLALSFGAVGIASEAMLMRAAFTIPYGPWSRACLFAAGTILAGEADMVVGLVKKRIYANL